MVSKITSILLGLLLALLVGPFAQADESDGATTKEKNKQMHQQMRDENKEFTSERARVAKERQEELKQQLRKINETKKAEIDAATTVEEKNEIRERYRLQTEDLRKELREQRQIAIKEAQAGRSEVMKKNEAMKNQAATKNQEAMKNRRQNK